MSSWPHNPGVACSGPGVQKGPRKGPTWPAEVESAVKDATAAAVRLSFPPKLHDGSQASLQFSSVQLLSCVWLCDPMNRSTPGLPVHHQLPEFTQTHVHRVGDAIQPTHPLLSHSPTALNLSQHQGLFKWVSSSHQMAKVLKFQLHSLYILTTMYIYVYVYV